MHAGTHAGPGKQRGRQAAPHHPWPRSSPSPRQQAVSGAAPAPPREQAAPCRPPWHVHLRLLLQLRQQGPLLICHPRQRGLTAVGAGALQAVLKRRHGVSFLRDGIDRRLHRAAGPARGQCAGAARWACASDNRRGWQLAAGGSRASGALAHHCLGPLRYSAAFRRSAWAHGCIGRRSFILCRWVRAHPSIQVQSTSQQSRSCAA